MAPYDRLEICIATQTLYAQCDGQPDETFAVSTAKAGVGQQQGSWQTPLGQHVVRARIGANAPRGAVFVRRRATGEIWSPELHTQHPERDWILTRILWLTGLEPGHNRGGDVDTLRRYIYIHGTPDTEPMREPASHGCVRMENADIERLFERVPVRLPVNIVARR
ncbi:MAG: L,D-transpeptidase family protein [Gammaproteobacteria bacterium]